MENFVVSARKYRPATFDTVVGQAAITGTLKNALRSSHLAQAFLFCGPRGVGKTTCARILAKTINCQNLSPAIEACNECDSCKSFSTGHSLNIFELDAASNNSVDDIRSLISQVSFAPQLGKYKVYIIDEVHMLSQAAFNAFLKTLEEPPKHAVFILATTEKHKIIPTILSRCQIFDFNRIQVKDIASHLATIASKEGINAEPDALHIIAQKADGALRDALSIFDQLVSFAGKTLTYQAVITNLNVLDYDYYFNITDHILRQKIPASLLVFNEILNKGFDGHNFIMGLAEHFRNLLVCKDPGTVQLLEVSDNIQMRYLKQSSECSLNFLLKGLEIANKCDVQYKQSKNSRLLVELSLMQLCSVDSNESAEKKKPVAVHEIKILPPDNISSATKPVPVSDLPLKIVEERAENYRKGSDSIPGSASQNATVQPVSNPAVRAKIKTNTISINDTLFAGPVKNEEEPDAENPSGKPADPIEPRQLAEAWSEFAERVKKQGKESLFSILAKRNPELNGSGNVIEFQVENKVMETAFLNSKPDLISFLYARLNNYSIEINLTIDKSLDQKIAYTNKEKFIKMAENFPNLLKFKQQLDLETD